MPTDVAHVRPGGVGFDTEDEVAGLPVVASGAAGEAAAQLTEVRGVFLGVAAHRADIETGPVIDRNRRGGRLGIGPCAKIGGGRRGHPKRDQSGRCQQNLLHVFFLSRCPNATEGTLNLRLPAHIDESRSRKAVPEMPHPRRNHAICNFVRVAIGPGYNQTNRPARGRPFRNFGVLKAKISTSR